MELGTNAVISPPRAPLFEKSNSSPPPPSSIKQVRRKSSFIRRIDSSEECPSPHGSIYEAYYFSTTNTSEESFNRIEQMGTDIPMAQLRTLDMTNPVVRNDLTTQIPEFKYGHGTVLDTIMEKKSSGTIRSLYRPRSADDVKKAPFLCHRDSFLVSKSPRRKHSFSLDDLQLVNRSYHEVCHEIYASPKVPVRDPLERPSTPPGMPSWTAAQTPTPTMPRRSYHIPGKPNRFQRFLGIEPSGVTFSSRIPHPETARNVSAPVTMPGSQQAPRFRPPRSAYGPISRHPFNHAPIAPIHPASSLSKKVRFTPSATARDSAEMNLRNALECTTATALHPMTPIHTMAPVLPIAQTDSTITKKMICLHQKTKASTFVGTMGAINVETCISVESCHNSVSSSAHLMSGALSPHRSPAESGPTSPVNECAVMDTNGHMNGSENASNTERFVPCWRCLFEKWVERAGWFWARASSCFCFVCCGYECDNESTVYGGYGIATGSGYFDQGIADRRHILEQMPASMV